MVQAATNPADLRAMARDMAGLPNTSDPNVYYDQQSKTLRSTGGSPDGKAGSVDNAYCGVVDEPANVPLA